MVSKSEAANALRSYFRNATRNIDDKSLGPGRRGRTRDKNVNAVSRVRSRYVGFRLRRAERGESRIDVCIPTRKKKKTTATKVSKFRTRHAAFFVYNRV